MAIGEKVHAVAVAGVADVFGESYSISHMAHTSEREKQIMRQTLRLLTSELRPRRVILFGSRAKGHATRSSDFDFAVDAERPAPPRWRRLARKIDAVAGLYRIDLVFLPQISKTFRNVILQTGRVIYER